MPGGEKGRRRDQDYGCNPRALPEPAVPEPAALRVATVLHEFRLGRGPCGQVRERVLQPSLVIWLQNRSLPRPVVLPAGQFGRFILDGAAGVRDRGHRTLVAVADQGSEGVMRQAEGSFTSDSTRLGQEIVLLAEA